MAEDVDAERVGGGGRDGDLDELSGVRPHAPEAEAEAVGDDVEPSLDQPADLGLRHPIRPPLALVVLRLPEL
ncbi:Uncharacterised protein [Mycobacteroides abscessus subsp. abscessus]|nr:Uncharacterised protein [Mycobacteroides abscessus subsp. abscessus]